MPSADKSSFFYGNQGLIIFHKNSLTILGGGGGEMSPTRSTSIYLSVVFEISLTILSKLKETFTIFYFQNATIFVGLKIPYDYCL